MAELTIHLESPACATLELPEELVLATQGSCLESISLRREYIWNIVEAEELVEVMDVDEKKKRLQFATR